MRRISPSARRQRSQPDCPPPESDAVLCPTMYAYERFGYFKHMGLSLGKPYNWGKSTVAHMLENELYIGNTINMRFCVNLLQGQT